MSENQTKSRSSFLLETIGEVLLEKEASLSSKLRDQTATVADQMNLAFASEVIALAKNRISVWENELKRASDAAIWVERTSSSHNPHIRLHGGVREDDPPK
ncbi:MAG: hypothetical protein HY22_04470 [[Candidatus Thermochlorobacteriaceae] bacterium GBChlB]|nr:MAG: hypothetical protein HY22_04470 [[Candidatus Thermochlorobacteriaceae] bacterium GBChlB]